MLRHRSRTSSKKHGHRSKSSRDKCNVQRRKSSLSSFKSRHQSPYVRPNRFFTTSSTLPNGTLREAEVVNPKDFDLKAIEKSMSMLYGEVSENFRKKLHRANVASNLQIPALSRFLQHSQTRKPLQNGTGSSDLTNAKLLYHDPETTDEWIYNKQSGVHPAGIFFVRGLTDQKTTKSHYYDIQTPTTPVHVEFNEALFNPQYKLNYTRDATFLHKTYDNIAYRDTTIEFYKPLPLDETIYEMRNVKENSDTRYYNPETPTWYRDDITPNQINKSNKPEGIFSIFKRVFSGADNKNEEKQTQHETQTLSQNNVKNNVTHKTLRSTSTTKQPTYLDTISYPYIKSSSEYTLYPYQTPHAKAGGGSDASQQTKTKIQTNFDPNEAQPIAKMKTSLTQFNNTIVLEDPRGYLLTRKQQQLLTLEDNTITDQSDSSTKPFTPMSNSTSSHLPSLPQYHVKMQYKVNTKTSKLWSMLSGNTNRVTTDYRYARKGGFKGQIIPHNLLTTLCLDAVGHIAKNKLTPPKPMVMEAVEEMYLQSLIESYKLLYLEQVQDAARFANEPEPDALTPEQIAYIENEALKDREKFLIPPWFAVFQQLKHIAVESINPVYFDIITDEYGNPQPLSNGINGSIGNTSSTTATAQHFAERDVQLNFYAQVCKDDFDYVGYQENIEERANDIMDGVEAVQARYNPPSLLTADVKNHNPDDLQSLQQYEPKQVTLCYDVFGKLRVPDMKSVMKKDDDDDGNVDNNSKNKNNKSHLLLGNGQQQQTMLGNEYDHTKISTWDSIVGDNVTGVHPYFNQSESTIYDVHNMDLRNRLYLDDDAILSSMITLSDIQRDKPALIKFWVTATKNVALLNNKNQNNNENNQHLQKLMEDPVMMGYAIFDKPLNPGVWNLLTKEETNNLFHYVQGVEVIHDVIEHAGIKYKQGLQNGVESIVNISEGDNNDNNNNEQDAQNNQTEAQKTPFVIAPSTTDSLLKQQQNYEHDGYIQKKRHLNDVGDYSTDDNSYGDDDDDDDYDSDLEEPDGDDSLDDFFLDTEEDEGNIDQQQQRIDGDNTIITSQQKPMSSTTNNNGDVINNTHQQDKK